MSRQIFDRLFDEGSRAVLAGEHLLDAPPEQPGERWGPSVCLRPDEPAASRLASLTAAAMQYAGPGHWPTGAARSSHFTVRVLDPYRGELTQHDPTILRQADAMRRAAAFSGPVALQVTGLTLTRASVMASATPIGPAAETFACTLAEELGEGGWYEADFDRSIWYTNLVHFTGPLVGRRELVDWVAARRDIDLGPVETRVELLHWVFDGCQMLPVVLAGLP
jgi:hypothetical protein